MPEQDVALSNQTIIILCTVGFASLGIAVYFLILRHVPSLADDDGKDEPLQNYYEFLDQSDVATLNRSERRARAKLHMKKARLAATVRIDVNDRDGGQNDDELDVFGVEEDAVLSRKERQRAAKALEKVERKISTEIARARREAEQKKKYQTRKANENSSANLDGPLKLIEMFPQRMAGSNHSLSEYLFYDSIMRKYKDNPQQFLHDSMNEKIMTIRTFVNRLQSNGFVSVASLSDEFGIGIEDACNELEMLNMKHGIIGLFDKGNFVYVSEDMIEEAIDLGNKSGKIPSQMGNVSVTSQ